MSKSVELDLINDVIKPTERQREFLRASNLYRFLLYGGAAGGGKSYILRWSLVWWLVKWASKGLRNVRVGLFCEDYPALEDRHLSKVREEFPEWLGTYRETTHDYRLANNLGAGVISFRNLDKPEKYKSSEFAIIAVDELTHNSLETFNALRFRLRWSGIDRTLFMGASNPGGTGHAWVKGLWVDRNFPLEMDFMRPEFCYIPAKVSDNPHASEQYAKDLASLPEQQRKAYLDGSWDIFAGQVFTEFDRTKHVVEPFDIPETWTRYRCLDWGFTRPFAWYWYAIDQDGTPWVYREYYGCVEGQPNTGLQLPASVVARNGKAMEAPGEHVVQGYADPAIWSNAGHTGPTIAEEFANEGVEWTKGDNDRMAGKMRIHEHLGDNRLKVFSTCRHLIRTLPALVYSETKVEDVDTDGEDHAYDSLRYGLMGRPRQVKKDPYAGLPGYDAGKVKVKYDVLNRRRK